MAITLDSVANSHTNPPTPGRVFGKQVSQFRTKRGWTQAELADRLTALGVPTERSAVARVETGHRGRVASVEEVFHYAVALGVSPFSLVLPRSEHTEVQVTPSLAVDAADVRAWLDGIEPLRGVDMDADDMRFFMYEQASDETLRAYKRWPQVQEVVETAAQMRRWAALHQPEAFGPLLNRLGKAVKRLHEDWEEVHGSH